MKQFKSVLCLLLALIMVLGLAACGAKDNADDTKHADDNKPANDKPADDAGDDETLDPNREVAITFMTRDSNTALYYDEIKAEIEKYVKDTYGMDIGSTERKKTPDNRKLFLDSMESLIRPLYNKDPGYADEQIMVQANNRIF